VSDRSPKRKKSVSWADEVGGDLECVEQKSDYLKSPDCLLPSTVLSESLDAKKVDVEEDMAVGMPSPMNPAPLTSHATPGPLTQPPDPIIAGKGEAPASDNSPLPENDGGDTQDGPPPSSYPSPQSSNTFTSWRDGEPGEPPDAPTEEGEPKMNPPPDTEPIPVRISLFYSSISMFRLVLQHLSGLKIRIPAKLRMLEDGVPKWDCMPRSPAVRIPRMSSRNLELKIMFLTVPSIPASDPKFGRNTSESSSRCSILRGASLWAHPSIRFGVLLENMRAMSGPKESR